MSLLAEAGDGAARIRQRAHAEGAALVARARVDGDRERDALLAEARARIDVDRAMAGAGLRVHLSEPASDLASRIVGEPVGTPMRRG